MVEIYCHCQYNFSQLQDFGDKKGTKIDEKEINQMVVKVMAEKNKEMEKKIIVRIWVTQGFQKVNPSG